MYGKIVIAILFVTLLIVFYFINPATNLFPRCPLLVLTGLKCAGCGSQRAIFCILHGQWRQAFFFNPLIVISLPYIIIGVLHQYTGLINHHHPFIKTIFGSTAIKIIATIFIGYFIARNVFNF
jgi:Protein of unknown function (DUF2752)